MRNMTEDAKQVEKKLIDVVHYHDGVTVKPYYWEKHDL